VEDGQAPAAPTKEESNIEEQASAKELDERGWG
jgi:hypothetical protein